MTKWSLGIAFSKHLPWGYPISPSNQRGLRGSAPVAVNGCPDSLVIKLPQWCLPHATKGGILGIPLRVSKWEISSAICYEPIYEFIGYQSVYPMVNVYMSMENHHFSWKLTISMAIFHSYVSLPECSGCLKPLTMPIACTHSMSSWTHHGIMESMNFQLSLDVHQTQPNQEHHKHWNPTKKYKAILASFHVP